MTETVEEYEDVQDDQDLPEDFISNRKTIVGDLMQFVLDEVRQVPDVWSKRSETDQKWQIEKVRMQCEKVVERVANLVASEGQANLTMRIEKVEFTKGEIKVICKGSRNQDARHDLSDHEGGSAILVLVDPEEYAGGVNVHKADKDQPDLPINTVGDNEQPDPAADSDSEESE